MSCAEHHIAIILKELQELANHHADRRPAVWEAINRAEICTHDILRAIEQIIEKPPN